MVQVCEKNSESLDTTVCIYNNIFYNKRTGLLSWTGNGVFVPQYMPIRIRFKSQRSRKLYRIFRYKNNRFLRLQRGKNVGQNDSE